MVTQEQLLAIEHLTLIHEDLTVEQEHSVLKVLDYIAELERQAEKREAELIRQVDCVIDLQAQLRAGQEFWVQPTADQKYSQADKTIFIENQGQWVGIQRGNVVLGVWLNELGCAVMRKVQPRKDGRR